jgi:tRNA G18 (ribose-2'-O)-methylase SpoU
VLCRRAESDPEITTLIERMRGLAIEIRPAAERERLRLSEGARAEALIALAGPPREPSLDALMAREGLVLVLVGLRYAGNVGFVVRAAEVAGTDGVVVAETWTRSERSSAMRFAMQADRFFPVLEADAESAIASARRAGRRLFALETGGDRTPWEVDWSGPVAVFLGGEAEGIPREVLERMDAILRIPMRGFIPSYNVQAAAGIVLGEWLRHTHASERASAGRPADPSPSRPGR